VQDPHVHLKNLKPSPVASPLVDACIECGFCESNCPSRDVTLTPRQRITSFREMSRLEGLDSRNGAEDERCAGPHGVMTMALSGCWLHLALAAHQYAGRLGAQRIASRWMDYMYAALPQCAPLLTQGKRPPGPRLPK